MPRTRSLAWSELKVGVLTIVATVIAAVLIFSLTGSKGFAWQRYPLKTRFKDVAGLAKGSPVRIAGVEVGSVDDVEIVGEQVDVTFEVKKDYRGRITDRSIARLGSVSLLGESAVDISPSSAGTPIPEYGYVPTGRQATSMAELTDQAGQGIEQLNGLIRDVRQGKGTVGKLMTEDALYAELRQFVGSADDILRTVRSGRGTLGKLVTDPAAAQALQASLENLQTMTQKINAGQGSIGKLLNDDAFAQSLTGATANLRDLVDRLNHGEGTAGKLMTDPALFNRMNDLTARLDDLVTRLNDGQGTAGQLLKDQRLYENMNKAVTEFQGLLAEIKRDPRRYLNVRVSIF